MIAEVCCALALLGGDEVPNARQTARATRRYNRVWSKADRFFGADGKPPPRLQMGGDSLTAGDDGQGFRRINVSDEYVRRLGRKKSALKGSKSARKNLTLGKSQLIHEMAHVYQHPMLTWADKQSAEAGALLAQKRIGRKIGLKNRRLKSTALFSGGGYGAWVPGMRAKYGPGFAKRGQFGPNWGRDPRTIRTPDGKNMPLLPTRR